MEGSYWGNKGKYQAFANELNKLIPVEGACANPRSINKALDKFRRASNAYYDIFNNGGGNRGAEIRQHFGFGMSRFQYTRRVPGQRYGHTHTRFDAINGVVDPIMDKIILAAAIEQGLVTEAQVKAIAHVEELRKDPALLAEVKKILAA